MIRVATINDIRGLNQLIELSARELSKEEYSYEEIEGAIRYVFGVDSELIADQTYFVIEQEGFIVACGGWSKRKTLFGGNQFDARERGYLDPQIDAAKVRAFFVHPSYARQGLGAKLLQFCEQQAKMNGFSKIEMMATLPGVKLYRNYGYKINKLEITPLPNGVNLKFMRMSKIV